MSVSSPRFALAGSWAQIPLGSEADTLSSIRKMVQHVTGRADQLATIRAQMRERFVAAADAARSGGASELFIGLELMPGIPLPAWIAVFPVADKGIDTGNMEFADFARAVDLSTGSAPEGGTKKAADIDSSTALHAVRHAWRRSTDLVDEGVERSFDFIEADYWIAASEPNRLALVTFSCALAEYEEEILELFDAMVSTMSWPHTVAV
ncbi:MAG: hypothetical protein ACRCSP_01845 [Rhodoglobus sp.]